MLDGSDRTLVVRVALEQAGLDSVVVKLHLPSEEGEAVVREPAALSLLGDVAEAPTLLGTSTDPPGVVLADLGEGTDLAALLLGADAGAAGQGVVAWAGALGRFQRKTRGLEAVFMTSLAEHAARVGRPVPLADPMSARLRVAAQELAPLLAQLGVPVTAEALEELRGLDGLLGGDVTALTAADACPDNNRWTPDGVVLLDLEGAQVRHIAWDAAYLTVPFPSCWCSWRLPEDLADRALDHWRAAFDEPYVHTSGFDADLRLATLGWALMSASWLLGRALLGTPQTLDELRTTPLRRAMIQHRLDSAPGDPRLPALARLVEQTAAACRREWGEAPLDLAPAFR